MNNSEDNVQHYFNKVTETIENLDKQAVENLLEVFLECYNKENTIFIFGNGGSGATASHVAGDFVKGVSYGLDKRFKFICLNDNASALSAISNDLSYEEVFVEQLKNFVKKDDLVVGLSGSGNSVNVVKAFEYAKSKNAKTVALCGFSGGKIKQIADITVHVPIHDMEITEDLHLIIFHALKHMLTVRLKGESASMGKQYDERIK